MYIYIYTYKMHKREYTDYLVGNGDDTKFQSRFMRLQMWGRGFLGAGGVGPTMVGLVSILKKAWWCSHGLNDGSLNLPSGNLT